MKTAGKKNSVTHKNKFHQSFHQYPFTIQKSFLTLFSVSHDTLKAQSCF